VDILDPALLRSGLNFALTLQFFPVLIGRAGPSVPVERKGEVQCSCFCWEGVRIPVEGKREGLGVAHNGK